MSWYNEYTAAALAELPIDKASAITAAEVAERLDAPVLPVMAAMTWLYLNGDAEKVFVRNENSRYWRST